MNVKFLPGWRQVKDESEKTRLEGLQKELSIFRAEIEYRYKQYGEVEYQRQKEMAHLRIRQVIGVVKTLK